MNRSLNHSNGNYSDYEIPLPLGMIVLTASIAFLKKCALLLLNLTEALELTGLNASNAVLRPSQR